MTVNLVITDITAATITCTAHCPVCQRPATVRGVPVAGFVAWRARGVPIWDALPGLSPAQRVVLAGGCHSRCSGVALPAEEEDAGNCLFHVNADCPGWQLTPEETDALAEVDYERRYQPAESDPVPEALTAAHLFTDDEYRVEAITDAQ